MKDHWFGMWWIGVVGLGALGGIIGVGLSIRDELRMIRQNMDLAPVADELSEKGIGPR